MKLIKSSFKIIPQLSGIDGIYKQIEICGRTCYKSEDKITEDSAKGFVDRMMKSNHGAMLEHGTVYLKFETVKSARHPLDKYYYNKYSKVTTEEGLTKQTKIVFVTTNLRVLVENDWMGDLQYLCEPTEYHEKRITVKFISDIGVNRETNRHRTHSIGEESTRYCNYSKDKFDQQITVIQPDEVSDIEVENAFDGETILSVCEEFQGNSLLESDAVAYWIAANVFCEFCYNKLIEKGWKPQQARRILPLDTKAELVHTAFISDWKHFFDLRADGVTGAPHPDIKKLAEPLKQNFIELGLYEI